MKLAVAALLAVAGLVAIPIQASAQAWPTKPVTLVVPFPPGGTTDVLARALADKLGPALGQTVIVESKPGAGATLGADYVAKAKPDGYTLLVTVSTYAMVPGLMKSLPFDPARISSPSPCLRGARCCSPRRRRQRSTASPRSSRTPRQIPASSTTGRPASARRITCRWSCSRT